MERVYFPVSLSLSLPTPSSEVTLNTAEEDPEEEITAMIREFKEEEESHREHPEAGGSSSGTHHSSRSAEFAHLGAELDAMD